MADAVWLLGSGTVALNASNTIVVTLTDAAAVGDLVSGWVAVQSNGTVTSVTDTGGNTWTTRPVFASGTFRYYWVDAILTTALNIGDTITLVCSTGANRKLALFHGISGQAVSPFDQQGAGASGTSTSPSITTGVPAQANSLILAGVYSALTAVTAEDADYTTVGDVVVENRYMHSAARIISAAEADTYAPTIGASQLWDTNYIIYKLADGPSPAPARRNLKMTMGVG